MKALVQEKAMAIQLRKSGASYKEILAVVPVAKSSLSLWLKDLPLTQSEKHVLKKRVNTNISKGRIRAAASNHQNKLEREQVYLEEARAQFKKCVDEPLFHTGIALYWAEGAKRNEMFQFMNSDNKMIEVFLCWLERYTPYKREDVSFRLYLHEPFKHDNWEKWWQDKLLVLPDQFKKTIVKPSHLNVKKRPNYKGCLRVEVPKSTKLLSMMKFWINLHVEYHSKE